MLDKLYENIGGKIKNWAKWIFIVETISAVFIGVCILVNHDVINPMWSVLFIFFGPLVSWISSWILYAFGELVEDIHVIRNQNSTIDKSIQVPTQSSKSDVSTKNNFENYEKTILRVKETTEREIAKKADNEIENVSDINQKISENCEDNLIGKLEYALRYRTDEGMIKYLMDIQDETVQGILKSPQHLIREQIKNLLSNTK